MQTYNFQVAKLTKILEHNIFPIFCTLAANANNRSQYFFQLSPRMLQSVRRHSAIVLTVTTNGMYKMPPVIHLLFKRNHK